MMKVTPSGLRSHLLQHPVTDAVSMATFILSLRGIGPEADPNMLAGLMGGFRRLPEVVPGYSFKELWDLLFSLAARTHPLLRGAQHRGMEVFDDGPSLPILSQNESASVTLTRAEIGCILANACLLNLVDVEHEQSIGSLALGDIFTSSHRVAVERVVCLLLYFVYWADPDHSMLGDNGTCDTVTFERVAQGMEEMPKWEESTRPIDTAGVRVHSGVMEESNCIGFADFANRDIHIHCVIGSATQEEVLFSCCPEAFVGLLLYPRLLDGTDGSKSEVGVIRNARRVCSYTGYDRTFTAGPPLSTLVSHDILVYDACYSGQFYRRNLDRDLYKAYLGFRAVPDISTGKWGCGVFNGVPLYKFLTQLMACGETGTRMDYSAFKDEDHCTMCIDALECIEGWNEGQGMTVGSLYTLILDVVQDHKEWTRASQFKEAMMQRLRGE
ncbi:poly(ADP-ribose) glycohydrolase [Kipferlia bialata]|uniref:poly(ADP-ribose) glycohydrolase n=1 Tax=Kipferlia bialata TaxID=797122 RepID=A0A9K3CW77_9EUKA|nr:poly(ADP-ribose) glycohydrolase [Kipferlia bialata]|eukprot:g4757.t1